MSLVSEGGNKKQCQKCQKVTHHSNINRHGLCSECNRKETKELKTYLKVKKLIGE